MDQAETKTKATYLDGLKKVMEEVVAPAAHEVDQKGIFPRAALDSLGRAGLLGLISAPEVGGLGEGHRSVADLRGKVVAVGAIDSPQATLIPLSHIHAEGLEPGADFEIAYNDMMSGKHGDHIGGERDAVRSLVAGKADAACIIDANHLLFIKEGTLPTGSTRVLTQTAPYDHCNFTVLSNAPRETVDRFRELLLAMSYEDSEVRPLMDLEGLKAWRPGRTEGYRALDAAVDEMKFYDRDGNIANPNYRY